MRSVRSITDMTILVVEDEYLIADDLARDLSDLGLRVVGPVATLDEAFAAVAAQRPDLAVLDINLRGDPVFPLADLLDAQGIPYTFTTGYDADAIPGRYARIPRHEKPLRKGALLATIERLAQQNASLESEATPPPDI